MDLPLSLRQKCNNKAAEKDLVGQGWQLINASRVSSRINLLLEFKAYNNGYAKSDQSISQLTVAAYNNHGGQDHGGGYYDNNYTTTSYGAQGGADGGGFLAGSQDGNKKACYSYYANPHLQSRFTEAMIPSDL